MMDPNDAYNEGYAQGQQSVEAKYEELRKWLRHWPYSPYDYIEAEDLRRHVFAAFFPDGKQR